MDANGSCDIFACSSFIFSCSLCTGRFPVQTKVGNWNGKIQIYMDHVKRKSVFEHAQNVRIHIALRMRKGSSGCLLSAGLFYSIQCFCLRPANVVIRLRRCGGWSGPSLFSHAPKARLWRLI